MLMKASGCLLQIQSLLGSLQREIEFCKKHWLSAEARHVLAEIAASFLSLLIMIWEILKLKQYLLLLNLSPSQLELIQQSMKQILPAFNQPRQTPQRKKRLTTSFSIAGDCPFYLYIWLRCFPSFFVIPITEIIGKYKGFKRKYGFGKLKKGRLKVQDNQQDTEGSFDFLGGDGIFAPYDKDDSHDDGYCSQGADHIYWFAVSQHTDQIPKNNRGEGQSGQNSQILRQSERPNVSQLTDRHGNSAIEETLQEHLQIRIMVSL